MPMPMPTPGCRALNITFFLKSDAVSLAPFNPGACPPAGALDYVLGQRQRTMVQHESTRWRGGRFTYSITGQCHRPLNFRKLELRHVITKDV